MCLEIANYQLYLGQSPFNDSPDEVYGLAIVKTPMSARVKYPYIGVSHTSRRHLLMWRRNEIPARSRSAYRERCVVVDLVSI
jgi:hypothetical protein